MWRNFGIMSGRASLSGGSSTDTSAGSAKQYYRADSNSIRLDEIFGHSQLPDLRGGETVSSFISNDDRELAAKCFVAGVVTVVGIFLFASWFVISQFLA